MRCEKLNETICSIIKTCAWCQYIDISYCIEYNPCNNFNDYCYGGFLNHTNNNCSKSKEYIVLSLLSLGLLIGGILLIFLRIYNAKEDVYYKYTIQDDDNQLID